MFRRLCGAGPIISPTPAKRTSAPRSETCIYTAGRYYISFIAIASLLLFLLPIEGLDALIGIIKSNVFLRTYGRRCCRCSCPR